MRQPRFLDGPKGPLFSLWFDPGAAADHAVLVVPPFAEEMNKSRRMLALQGEALARAGTGMLLLDLYGTGDSAGEFAEAEWQTWLTDLECATRWLAARGVKRISLLAQRLGALLAVEFLPRSPLPVARLLFWHPVIKGQQAVTQFLRLRLAAGMMAGEAKETAAGLRGQAAAGETLEIAGYALAPGLLSAMDAADLSTVDPAALPPVDWIELAPAAGRTLSPAARGRIEAWREGGAEVTEHLLVGDSFWATQEIASVPALVDLTCRRLTET